MEHHNNSTPGSINGKLQLQPIHFNRALWCTLKHFPSVGLVRNISIFYIGRAILNFFLHRFCLNQMPYIVVLQIDVSRTKDSVTSRCATVPHVDLWSIR